MPTQLVRNRIAQTKELYGKSSHPRYYLTHGMKQYPEGNLAGSTKREAIQLLAQLEPSEAYKKAFERWETAVKGNFQYVRAALAGRLYIGVTRENSLEAGVTVHHTYGMPLIPGSAVKGLCRAEARRSGLAERVCAWLFGQGGGEANGEGEDESGAVRFFDAWWVPTTNERPFVTEVITPHHTEYYSTEGQNPATEFDSPVPATQVAVRGRFLFAWDASPEESAIIEPLLVRALTEQGIGGKRTTGYGLFREEEIAVSMAERNKLKRQQANEQKLSDASPLLAKMLLDGYDEPKKKDAFSGKMNSWLDEMEKGGADSEEILRLLTQWWQTNFAAEWNKPSLASPKAKEKIARLKQFASK